MTMLFIDWNEDNLFVNVCKSVSTVNSKLIAFVRMNLRIFTVIIFMKIT